MAFFKWNNPLRGDCVVRSVCVRRGGTQRDAKLAVQGYLGYKGAANTRRQGYVARIPSSTQVLPEKGVPLAISPPWLAAT